MDKTTKSVQSASKPNRDSTTQKHLPFSEIRDNCLIMKDGSSRMVLRVKAINFSLKSQEEQDSIIISYQRFLNSLRYPIQIIVRSLKVDIEAYLLKLKNLALKQPNRLLQEQTYRYVDFLTNLVDMAQIMRKDFYIVVPYDADPDNRSVRDPGMFGLFRSFWSAITSEESVASIREKRRNAKDLRKANLERLTTIKTSLEAIGINSEEVSKDDIIKLLINYYNPKVGGDTKIKETTDAFGLQ